MKIQKKLKQNVKYEKGKTEDKQQTIYSFEEVAFFLSDGGKTMIFLVVVRDA